MRFCALCILAGAPIAPAQPRPLNVVSHGNVRPISILEIRIQELKYGHEGPDYFPVDRAPFRGTGELVKATLTGQEGIATVRFELVSESGQRLSVAPAFRIGDGADADEYFLQAEVPPQPFRFRIQGRDLEGRAFASVFSKVFVPFEGSAPKPQLPPGLTPQESRILEGLIDSAEAETRARFESARNAYPDGTIRIARSTVSAATYEPLVSSLGNVLGVRVRFTSRFEDPGDYALSPHVFPLYANFRWRGTVGMKVLDAAVDPAPPAAPTTPADGVTAALLYGGATHYESNVEYHFRFDLVPDYVIRNAGGTRYCLYTELFRAGGRLPVWDEIRASEEPVKYRVDLSSLDFVSETSALRPQKAYYEGFLREGAQDCGPTPNTHF